MRIVKVYSLEQWTGKQLVQGYVEAPDDMDLQAQEAAWFKAGGDSLMRFKDYLIQQGCKPVKIERHSIGYM